MALLIDIQVLKPMLLRHVIPKFDEEPVCSATGGSIWCDIYTLIASIITYLQESITPF